MPDRDEQQPEVVPIEDGADEAPDEVAEEGGEPLAEEAEAGISERLSGLSEAERLKKLDNQERELGRMRAELGDLRKRAEAGAAAAPEAAPMPDPWEARRAAVANQVYARYVALGQADPIGEGNPTPPPEIVRACYEEADSRVSLEQELAQVRSLLQETVVPQRIEAEAEASIASGEPVTGREIVKVLAEVLDVPVASLNALDSQGRAKMFALAKRTVIAEKRAYAVTGGAAGGARKVVSPSPNSQVITEGGGGALPPPAKVNRDTPLWKRLRSQSQLLSDDRVDEQYRYRLSLDEE